MLQHIRRAAAWQPGVLSAPRAAPPAMAHMVDSHAEAVLHGDRATPEDEDAAFEAIHAARAKQKERRQSLMTDVGPMVCEQTAAITAGFATKDEEDAHYDAIVAAREQRRLSHRMSWNDEGPLVCEVSQIAAGFDCEHEEELHRDDIIKHREQEKQRRQSTYEDHDP